MKNIFVSIIFIFVTFFVFANHVGTAIPVTIGSQSGPPAIYLEKTDHSHRHIILQGSDFHRGSEFGKFTKDILFLQESTMTAKLDHFIGNILAQKALFTGMMLWFHDVDHYIDSASLEEMQGVALWAPKQFESLASNYTRQIAYHGLHEVGQMFVDEDRGDMGCYVSAILSKKKRWVIGRNFDFDIDGIFDREKILKWVFPDKGYAYLSVVWPGMVGVVSGVNDQGIYASINAAGSSDFTRVGTPTSILIKNILLKAKTLDEAIMMMKDTKVFITEIFVIGDQKNNSIAVIEKSPAKMNVLHLVKSEVIANHLEASIWNKDEINYKRKMDLTSDLRKRRGLELIQENLYDDPVFKTASILRDKNLPGSLHGHPGNRGAIDSFIASQSLIFDMEKNIFYVNLGPGTTGKYLGYDLKKSFSEKYPVVAKELSAQGPSLAEYESWQKSMKEVTQGIKDLDIDDCQSAGRILEAVNKKQFIHYDKSRLEGEYASKCLHDDLAAKKYWREALAFNPPYAKQRHYLEERLK